VLITILLLVALLAFANGSNDNCKGVATLVGFGAASPRRALGWATVTTALGAAVSFWLAGGLVKSFSTGLFAAGTPLDAPFFAAVLIGAVGWILFATFTGLPVSTTHAITGGLVGAGFVAFAGGQLRWSELGSKFALPLALSPLLAMAIVYLCSWPALMLVRRFGGRCVCVVENAGIAEDCARASAVAVPAVSVIADTEETCAQASPLVAVSASATANAVHWASSGLVGFARGWNDAPKIAALGIATLAGAGVANGTAIAFAIVTVAMAVGGLVAGRRVLETLSRKVTPLPLAESLTASVVTASLVSAASWVGLPVSTTHVSTGAIVGAGVRNDPRSVRWGKVGEIVLSWLVTLPVAALVAAVARYLI
jgi:PiT family inorganic phosphate transporter